VPGGRKALVVATYAYSDGGLKQLEAPEHDAESFASVLEDPAIAGFDVTMLVNQPHYVVGEAIADFYAGSRSEDLTVLYFTGHGLKDDEGRLYLAMTNTRREALMFTAISGAQLNDAMDSSRSRRKVLILDCCYSGAFPAGRSAKADEGVQTLERFQGKGRAVLTASDATQYAFEGDDLRGSGTSSVFTRYLVEAISSGAADLDEDGDIALDELYSYVYEKVVAEMPQQRPKKQEDVDGRILIARNVHWTLPAHLQHAVESPIAAQRLSAVEELGHLHRAGNDIVRAAVAEQVVVLASDDSRSVSTAATALLERLGTAAAAPLPAAPPQAQAPRVAAPAPAEAPVAGPPQAEGRGSPASASPAAPVRTAPSRQRSAARFLLGLVLVAGVLLTVSRSLAFEASYGYHAASLGWSTANWVVQALLPLVVAAAVLVAGRGSPAALGAASGVVVGVTLSLLAQLLMSGVDILNALTYRLGPAWWVILVAALVLAVGVAAGVRAVPLRGRVGSRRDRWAAAGGALVVVSAVIWILVGWANRGVGWWLYLRIAGPLLAAACLPVAVLRLDPVQRVFGLAAVTTTGAWLAAAAVETLTVMPWGASRWTAPALVMLAATLLSVGGAYLGQARAPTPRPAALR
jgi:hypothetical protein